MKIAGGIFLIVMGGLMLIKPNLMWKISESWKTKSNSGATDLYILIVSDKYNPHSNPVISMR